VGAASGNETLLGSYRRLLEQTQRRTVAVATAAHELKTPLAVLSGYLELLHGPELGPLNERQQQVLTEARLNCARLQRFIQDFLTYSALETGKFTLKLERSDLNACLSELYGFWLARFRAKGVALFFPINSRLGPFYFDPYKIQQVVSNLLENALRLTPAGGTVWLSAEPHWWERRVALPDTVQAERRNQQTAAANAVRISVADTGPGIPPEYHGAGDCPPPGAGPWREDLGRKRIRPRQQVFSFPAAVTGRTRKRGWRVDTCRRRPISW